jgi:uncharacterized protein (DUF2384 family)
MTRPATIKEQILDFFDGNEDKANAWWSLPNPLLGGISPTEMITMGRVEKLAKFVLHQLGEGKP